MPFAPSRFDTVQFSALSSVPGSTGWMTCLDLDRIAGAAVGQWRVDQPKAHSISDGSALVAQAAVREKEIATLLCAWRLQVRTHSKPVDFERVSCVFDVVMALLQSFGPARLNMEGLSAAEVSGELLVASLRASYRWREEVIGWHQASVVARRALELDGYPDIELCMAGLE